ncbi:hypothetical protein C9374_012886 [Naegleria lovaniensis]|uniref:Uncharacterized protein n=1 Tax=Naegleria lovaniensis TaxID=51637 RepID=A0AA88KBF1_NAELO|nr:uncharacterized protein C9374_012886 [Naegleria lovaniensis]KAG2373040.1 hypothetical protein C9374_012886 [Naegleria lovaniensis]
MPVLLTSNFINKDHKPFTRNTTNCEETKPISTETNNTSHISLDDDPYYIQPAVLERVMNRLCSEKRVIEMFDSDSIIECMENCGVSPTIDVTTFNIERLKCGRSKVEWVEFVLSDMKQCSEKYGTKILYQILQHCGQADINKWMKKHPSTSSYQQNVV